MTHRKNKIFTIVSWIAISFITFVSATMIFWLLYPYPVSTIEEPIRILNKNNEVAVGEPIIQELKITKPNNIAPADPTRVIICDDGNLVTMAGVPSALNLPIGSYTFVNDKYILPPKVAVGAKCSFVWTQTYQVNPIRKIAVEWTSEQFKIVKG